MVRVTSVIVCLAFLLSAGVARAQSTVDDLKREVEKLRKEINQRSDSKSSPISRVDAVTGGKYGPNSQVTTTAGKLQIDGLIQVWYQSVQNDNIGITRNDALVESNEGNDNDTFRIRRTEMKFTIDIHENVVGVIMIDPSREHNIGYLPLPTFVRHDAPFNPGSSVQNGTGLQSGNTIVPQLLQDAYINFHGIIPHHDFTVGQFIPPAGEEAWRSSGHLEFVERAMVTGVGKVRDIGAMVHGSWIDNRIQYWVGAFNGPGGTVLTDPEIVEGGNRADDNDEKDISWRVAVRPVWNKDCWHGRLELGYARTDGIRGESGSQTNSDEWINGINKQTNDINRQAAWAWYRPGGPVSGLWFRGEWGSNRDRIGGSTVLPVTQLLQLGGGEDVNGNVIPLRPTPVTISGWYFGTGYKMSESRWAEDLRGCDSFFLKSLYDMEFAFRYETYENITTEDLNQPDRHTDEFKTSAYTAGINYYIKGYDAKIQANYIWVDEPSDGNAARGLREIRNNAFVVNFQVMF